MVSQIEAFDITALLALMMLPDTISLTIILDKMDLNE
jgi:hypothetical protein